jgi:hypothetical protein
MLATGKEFGMAQKRLISGNSADPRRPCRTRQVDSGFEI